MLTLPVSLPHLETLLAELEFCYAFFHEGAPISLKLLELDLSDNTVYGKLKLAAGEGHFTGGAGAAREFHLDGPARARR